MRESVRTASRVFWAARLPCRILPAVEDRLGQFEVPVAEFMPDKLVDGRRRVVETVFVQPPDHLGNGAVQPRPDPAVGNGLILLADGNRGIVILQVHHGESRRVPDLVHEKLVPLDPLLRHPDVPPLGGEGRQREAEGVRPEFVHHLQGIDAVPLRLAHLLAVLVPDEGVEVNIPEGDVLHHVEPHHHHPGDPEEEDVEAGHQQRRGIEGLERFGLLGPSQGRKGPQRGAEPGVEDILLLAQLRAAAIGAAVGILRGDDHLPAPLAGPDGDPVAPPDLPRDAPVADVVHPLEIGGLPGGRHDAGLSRHHRGDRPPWPAGRS